MHFWKEKQMEKIQEILNKGLEDYEKKHKIINYKKKVINAIKDCKTGKIGAHKYVGKALEEIPEEHRKLVEKVRSYGYGL